MQRMIRICSVRHAPSQESQNKHIRCDGGHLDAPAWQCFVPVRPGPPVLFLRSFVPVSRLFNTRCCCYDEWHPLQRNRVVIKISIDRDHSRPWIISTSIRIISTMNLHLGTLSALCTRISILWVPSLLSGLYVRDADGGERLVRVRDDCAHRSLVC